MIAKYANMHGPARATAKYVKQFPKLSESTVRGWVAKYRKELSGTENNQFTINDSVIAPITIGQKRGRPLSLPTELDAKLRRFIICHVIHGVLMGLIKSDLSKYGSCLDFNVTRGWINYLYKRMNMVRRMVTTSRPRITRSIWEETRFIFLEEIAQAVSCPDELIINVDQTPSKFVPTDNVTMAVRGTKHIPRTDGNDKRGITTVTLSETLNGVMLPFQLIYKGKTARSLPSVPFPEGFSLSDNESHWSNQTESLKLLKEIINPYVEKVKEEMGLPVHQKALLIWDAFRGQNSQLITDALDDYNIVSVMVPKKLTHLLQPLDLTTNGSFKKIEKAAFSNYFTTTITKELQVEPEKDVTTIKVDRR